MTALAFAGDGGIPWNVLLFLPVQLLALAVGIGVAALLLGRRWDRDHAGPTAAACICTTCGKPFTSRNPLADDCGQHQAGPAGPQPATREGPP